LILIPLPNGEGRDFDFLSLSGGRGGTARRWVRGLFADDTFVALSAYWTLDFDGVLTHSPCRYFKQTIWGRIKNLEFPGTEGKTRVIQVAP